MTHKQLGISDDFVSDICRQIYPHMGRYAIRRIYYFICTETQLMNSDAKECSEVLEVVITTVPLHYE